MLGEIDLRQAQGLSALMKTPGRPQVCVIPSGGLARSDRSGGADYAELESRFGDVAVRDLLWLLCSPGLLRAGAGQIPQAQPEMQSGMPSESLPGTQLDAGRYPRQTLTDLLRQLDAQPARLHAQLAASPQKRLGHYAEQLLAFFLGEGAIGRLIASNLPLRRANQTLGECDFLLETHDGVRLHWELAVKCYLFVDEPNSEQGAERERGEVALAGGTNQVRPADTAIFTATSTSAPANSCHDYTGLARYVGPNLADRFDLKLTRMVKHQLPLSARPEFLALVAGGPWQAELFLRGWLFYPLAPQRSAACFISELLEPQHMRGWWASVGDWQRWQATLGAEAWMILPRLEWMAQRRFDAGVGRSAARLGDAGGHAVLDAAGMLERLGTHFGERALTATQVGLAPDSSSEADPKLLRDEQPHPKHAGPVLIAGLKRRGDVWVECTRGFVVDAGWFARARVYAASRQPGKASLP